MIERSEVRLLICELRQRLGVTPETLAHRLGVSAAAITRWEKDCALASPSPAVLERIECILRELGPRGTDLLMAYFLNAE